MSPLVSIVMATHNRAEFLREAVESVMAQTYENWELCLLNRGADTETADYCKTLTDKRIKVFASPQGTQGQALNLGLEKAKGQYVCFHDDDDLSHPQRLELCLARLGRADGIIPAYVSWHDMAPQRDRLEARAGNFLPKLLFAQRIKLQKLGGFRTLFAVHEDMDLQRRWEQAGWEIAHYPAPLYVYRNHLQARVSEEAVHYGGLYALAVEVSATACAQNTPDPVEQGVALEQLAAQLPAHPDAQHILRWFFLNSAKYGLQRKIRRGENIAWQATAKELKNILQKADYAGNIPLTLWRLRLSLAFLQMRTRRFAKGGEVKRNKDVVSFLQKDFGTRASKG